MTAEAIQAAYEKFIETEERRQPQGQRAYVYASSWSACTRQMALDLLRPDVKPAFQADTLANFRRGNDRARDIKSDMTRVGRECDPPFDVVGAEERFELRDKKGRVVIVGKVDFRLKFRDMKGSAPVETKSFHPSLVQGVKTFEDMFRNRWTRKGAFQLLAYLLATNEPVGFMLLDRPGIPRPIEVKLFEWLDKIEDFLQRAEIAMDARENVAAFSRSPHLSTDMRWDEKGLETYLPPFIEDPSECRVCPFFGVACNPPLKYEGAKIFTDEGIIQKTERYAELDAMPEIEEHAALDKFVKKTFRGVEQGIVGKCLVSGKWQKQTNYPLPDDVKTQIEETKKPYAVTVEQGKFTLNISKVSE